jgi:hypothetical protein
MKTKRLVFVSCFAAAALIAAPALSDPHKKKSGCLLVGAPTSGAANISDDTNVSLW